MKYERADEIADGQAVRSAGLVEIVGGEPAAGAGHIIDNHSRIARDVLRHVARKDPRVGIESSAGGKANDHADGFALVEILVR